LYNAIRAPYFTSNIIRFIKSRRNRWVRPVAGTGKIRDQYKILVGEAHGERPVGIHRYRRENNIKMDRVGIGCEGTDWIQFAHD
jgi:hypothetical protein